ncbi:multicopper oxidase mco [bacterium BMS3Abin05]|nr:multicopper oxidase mco [bacterium BMS3Abin05]GBE28714.1 multicopper oxidase mco [bacterium BMS3Bbin03]
MKETKAINRRKFLGYTAVGLGTGLGGPATRIQHYTAHVIKGDKDVVQALENSYLGPIFRLKTGQKVRVPFTNQIDQETIVHWHGLHVPEQADGHPRFVIKQGQAYIYEFELKNRAATYWFHPHPHGRTGPQVYNGLAGLFLCHSHNLEHEDLGMMRNYLVKA